MSDRVKIRGGFTTLPNDFVRSEGVSLSAKGFLAIVVSHADGWDFRRDDMMKKAGCGKKKYYAVLNELKRLGYLSVVPRVRSDGTFSGSEWIVNFSPCPQKGDTDPCTPKGDNPCTPKGDTKNNKRIKNPPNPPGGDGKNFSEIDFSKRKAGVPQDVLKILAAKREASK